MLEISKQQGFETGKGKMMKETYYFEQLFNAGVEQEDAETVLRQYLNAGAKVALRWKKDANVYLVYLLVSTLEDENEIDQMSYVFGNFELQDSDGFVDGITKTGTALSEDKEVFTYCEGLLLNKFGVSRDELEEIYTPW